MTSDGTPAQVADMDPESRAKSGRERIAPRAPAPASASARDGDAAGASTATVDAKRGLSVTLEKLRAFYGEAEQVKGIDLDFRANEVTAIIGPSGCGKSTLVRCVNRMHEEIPGAHAEGRVMLDELDVYDPSVDVVAVRRAIGMVFQKPNPFPTMSVFDNVAAGLRLSSSARSAHGRRDMQSKVEAALRWAGLWDEVADRLGEPGAGLSGGQQQRLCIARAIATDPEILLMDEPCSALDPRSTAVIEDLILQLRSELAIVIVTHNLQQARRVADRVAFMYLGDLVELGDVGQLFEAPREERTREYIAGAFG